MSVAHIGFIPEDTHNDPTLSMNMNVFSALYTSLMNYLFYNVKLKDDFISKLQYTVKKKKIYFLSKGTKMVKKLVLLPKQESTKRTTLAH